MGKIATVMVPVLAVSLIGTAYWGYKEHQEKNAILIKTENQYQEAFQDLSFYIKSLEDELGKSIAVNSRKQLGPNLTHVWRISYAAQNAVGHLPLTLMPFNKTEAFLSRIGDFSYKTAVRDLDKEPLTEHEWNVLQSLYKSAGEIHDELNKVQDKIISKQLRWMDVEAMLADPKKKSDNSIIDGFKLIDQRVSGYSEIETKMNTQNSEEIRIAKLKKLTGKEISEQEAKRIALDFVGAEDGKNVKISKTSKEANLPSYDINILDPKSKKNILVEVSKKGGHVVWMLNTRNVGRAQVSLEHAAVKASRFIKQKNLENMELSKTELFDHEGVFTFVRNDKGIKNYLDAVVVKVALDNGEVVGYHAEDHIINNRNRSFTTPKLTVDQAKTHVNRNLKISEESLALIENDLNQEVLCYEFSGSLDRSFYRIYINADTGEEEKVEKIEYLPS
jgi:spore germination protein